MTKETFVAVHKVRYRLSGMIASPGCGVELLFHLRFEIICANRITGSKGDVCAGG
jgi:hypothetical protein